MLSALLAHQGELQGLHDLWSRWNTDPVLVLGLAAAIWTYRRGARRPLRPRDVWRARACWLGLAAIGLALLSPLDALAAELASAHMVQHVLLVLVAGPLLAYSAPMPRFLTGAPVVVRRSTARARRRLRHVPGAIDTLRSPALAWVLHAATLWFWHASVPYDAALDSPVVHAIEHATFLATGVLFWSALLPMRAAASHGYGALLVFTMAMQSTFLAALLTFAGSPWYAGYRQSTETWGLRPLADQQLAGVIMWVPAGLVYVGLGILLVAAWVRESGLSATGGPSDDEWSASGPPDRALTRLR